MTWCGEKQRHKLASKRIKTTFPARRIDNRVNDSYDMDFARIFNELNLKGWSYNVTEYDDYHEYCPMGFDVFINPRKKHIQLDIYTQNDIPSNERFWSTVKEEIQSTVCP